MCSFWLVQESVLNKKGIEKDPNHGYSLSRYVFDSIFFPYEHLINENLFLLFYPLEVIYISSSLFA